MEKDIIGKDYVCPQCGPDPEGLAAHAEKYHTFPESEYKDKFTRLCAGCKHSVEIRVNDHRDYYQSVEDYFKEQLAHGGTQGKETMDDVVDPEIYAKCVETNNIVYVHFYPRTANGFYAFYHYDVDLALDLALETLRKDTNGKS